MKTPPSPLEKKKLSYSTKIPKDGDSEFDGNQMTPPSFSLRPSHKEDKTTPKSPKNKRNKIPKSIEYLEDSDDNFEWPTIDERVKEHISYDEWKYMVVITLLSQVPFNFNIEGWTFKESIFGDPEEGELMDKPALPLKRQNYKGREEVSDMVMIMLDSWIIHLFKGKF
jgi:hypothetical protein